MMALIGPPFTAVSARLCAGAAAAMLVSTITLPSRVTIMKVLLCGTRTAARSIPSASEIQLADERLHQRAARRRIRRFPIGPTRECEKALLVEIFLEHV